MDRIIEKLDRGWWIVSHEQKLWLPGGELPHGEAVNFDLVGQHALHIGEWQGESVWMVRQDRRHDMGSLRQVLDQDPGLFQLAGRGIQLAEFYRSHKFCGYCGHPMHASKTEWAMLCSHCRERYYPQIAPALSSLSVATIRSCWRSIPAIATAYTPCWPGLSKWAKPWSRRWPAR
jgi:NAD+ diphosphatase